MYIVGTRTRVSSVEEMTPPMTAAASGARDSAPASNFSTNGIMANTTEAVVITMGRRRKRPASTRASVRPKPG